MKIQTLIFILLLKFSAVLGGNYINDYIDNDWKQAKNTINSNSLLWSGIWVTGMYALSYQDENLIESVKPIYNGNWKYYFNTVDYLGYAPCSIPVSIGFAGLTFLFNDQKLRHAALTSVESALVSSFFVGVLKYSIGRYRPYQNKGSHFFKPFTDVDASFPSGHSAVAFALITPFAYYYDSPSSYALLIFPISTGISRILLDKHWTTDVLTGGLIGYLVGYYLTKWHKDYTKINKADNTPPLLKFSIPL